MNFSRNEFERGEKCLVIAIRGKGKRYNGAIWIKYSQN
jgi:hypothetical protein